MSKDFYETLGYEMPDGVGEVKSESFEYYRHPVGIYSAIFGRLNPKYKDLNGQKCTEDTPGATISHFIAPLWITKFLGIPSAPVNKAILAVSKDKILIPADVQAAELYYPLMISYNPKDQWKVHRIFESFAIPNHDSLRIVSQNPSKMTEKITNFKNFPAYYGIQIKFIIDPYISKNTGKESTILATLELLPQLPKIDGEIMHQLEADVNGLIEREIASRQSEQSDSGYTPEAPPSADGLFNEDVGEYS